jgi:hypothetical protein
MSLLLDDVSIVVTPNGYKAGTLYGVLPTYTEGSEEVTYPNFTNSDISQWIIAESTGVDRATKSWDTSGFMRLTYDLAVGSALYATFGQTLNVVYKVTMRVRGTKADGVTAQGSAFASIGDINELGRDVSNPTLTSEWQDYEFYTVSTGSTFRFYLSSATIGDLVDFDSISVKEVTSSDMDVTRETAATRVDEDGLVNYAEILGDEEVTDGNFPLPNTNWNLSSEFTIADNKLHCVSSGSYQYAYQNTVFTVGKTYKVTFDITGWTLGAIRVRPGGGAVTHITANGSYTLYYTILSGGTQLFIERQIACDMYLENISVKEVTRDNVPRIDYTGGGCPHILAEPERTNLVEYSEDFREWSIARATLGANITAPNGANDGYSIIATAVADDHYVSESISVVDTNIYTYSAYLKKGSKSWARLWNTLVGYVDFDLENGVVGTQSSAVGSIELFGDGWYRCSIVYTATSTGNNSHRIYTLDGDNDKVFLGDGSTINLYMFGAQLEAGSYATSYIPNFGTSSGVTRNQDIFSRDGIGSLINSEEGSFFIELAALNQPPGSQLSISLSGNGSNDRILIYTGLGGGEWITQFRKNGTSYVTIKKSTTITNQSKVAVSWKSGKYLMYIDGDKATNYTTGSETEATTFDAGDLKNLQFNPNYGTTGNPFFGKVKQLQVYDTALTDEQLLQLTGESGTDFYESYAEMAAALTYTIQ